MKTETTIEKALEGIKNAKEVTTTDLENIQTTLESLAKGHFIEWKDKTYTKIDVQTIKALQKLWFGGEHAGL